MQQLYYRDQRKLPTTWSKLTNGLLYLPGAAVMLYGLWLSMTT
ncbi:MAG: hypothetical protein V3R76_08185 [Gammaproteobacteria bacterium]